MQQKCSVCKEKAVDHNGKCFSCVNKKKIVCGRCSVVGVRLITSPVAHVMGKTYLFQSSV